MSDPSIPSILSGERVMICRPEPGASELAHVLTSVGAQCLKFPMLEINEIELGSEDKQIVLNLDEYQHIIVVSQHAAEIALKHIDEYWPQLPLDQNWYPIGRKTQSILQDYGIECVSVSADLDSESLVQQPGLQNLIDQKVLLIKGSGGREFIKEKLAKKAERFDSLSVYERLPITYEASALTQYFDEFAPEFIVALSGETLIALVDQASKSGIDLSDKSFILSSTRVANMAYEVGIKNVYVPGNLMPIDIIRCIKKANTHTHTGLK